MNRRLLLLMTFLVCTAGTLSFVAPFCIGYTLQNNVLKRLKNLDKHPQYQFTLKSYEKDLFQSKIALEIISRSHYKNKPKLHIVIQENIQHGPIIFDKAQKKLLFKLAAIHSHVLLQDTPFIKFDQKAVQFSSYVNYRWKEDFLTRLDKISATCLLAENKPCAIELHNMEIKGNLGFSSLNILQNMQIQEILLSSSPDARIKFNHVSLHNNLDLTHSILDNSQDEFKAESLEIHYKKNTLLLEKPSVIFTCETESNPKLLTIKANVSFEKMLINDKPSGPLHSRLAITHFPKIFIADIEKLERISRSNSQPEFMAYFTEALQQDNLTLSLEDFNLHIPGGVLTLQGNYSIDSHDNAKQTLQGKGKFITQIPKAALHQLLKPTHINSLLASGLFIELENHYQNYCVLKDSTLFINGSNPKDPLFFPGSLEFKQPLTPEQKLTLAILAEDTPTIQTLVKDKVHLLSPTYQGKYPIHMAAYMGNNEALKLFLDQDHPVDLVDDAGNTALYWAARSGHVDSVKTLMDFKANINAKNIQGWTPLQEAAENGHSNIVALLLEKDVKVNAQDNEGRTALFWAAKEGHGDIIKLLLNNGADPCIFNVRNLTPLDIAKEYKRTTAIAELNQCPHCN